jgi:murein DD-endopeptidase MepM/ murein hydrolase activator NlpD
MQNADCSAALRAAFRWPSGRAAARRALALLLLAVLPTTQGWAQSEPQLRGSWQQGGLIRGQTAPGAKVWFKGRPLRVSPSGEFAFGLGYEEPAAAELRIEFADGQTARHEYVVQPRQYDVQNIAGLPDKMVNPPPSVQKRIDDDLARVTAARAHDSEREDFVQGFAWPVSATVTGVYGSRRVLNGVSKQPHFGIDLAASEGTPVKASAGGVVRLADRDLYYTGGTVIIDHGHGVSTTYLHLSRLDVKPGESVRAGQIIGKVGKTGRATGPHLCWRANWFDVRLDASLLVGDQAAIKGESK